MKCPTCGLEMMKLGDASTGVWHANGRYRCSECPVGSNRFVWSDGKLVLAQEKAA